MSVCCVLILVTLAVCSTAQPCRSEEFAGKLERVDIETVTLIGSDNKRMVVRVDTGNRYKAAPFLGKTVTVDVNNDQGECRAIRFRSVK
ncbi:MAG TPA: hypothetical protein VK463_01670 [Desulfomonilaceae bacterium]|nr:hypothetical protein [Desulfomonilaceae bacterium]